MNPYIKITLISLISSFFISCSSSSSEISSEKVFKSKINLQVNNDNSFENELFFQKTKGQKFYVTKNMDVENKWLDIKVARSDGQGYINYSVMKNVVTQNDYNGYGSKKIGISNISFSKANIYCSLQLNAQLMSPYVFDSVRANKQINKPLNPISLEMISSYDEDNDEMFSFVGDNIDVSQEGDSSFIVINWKKEKYFNVSNTYKAQNLAFRCIRSK